MPPVSPLQLFKSLSDETRLSLVLLLREKGELCVCELTSVLKETQPKISRHLALLGWFLTVGKENGSTIVCRLICRRGQRRLSNRLISASGMISASSAGRLNAITPPPTASLSAFKNLPVYIWIIEYITHRKFISPV